MDRWIEALWIAAAGSNLRWHLPPEYFPRNKGRWRSFTQPGRITPAKATVAFAIESDRRSIKLLGGTDDYAQGSNHRGPGRTATAIRGTPPTRCRVALSVHRHWSRWMAAFRCAKRHRMGCHLGGQFPWLSRVGTLLARSSGRCSSRYRVDLHTNLRTSAHSCWCGNRLLLRAAFKTPKCRLTIRSSRPRVVASATCLPYASTRPPPRCGAA
jgi:hypothetical protein